MTKYDWLEFCDKQNKELNAIRNKPIVLEFGPYSCFIEDNVVHYLKYCKEIIEHEVPSTKITQFSTEDKLNFIGYYTNDNLPQNPKQNDIFLNRYTNETYIYNNSKWTLLTFIKQYEVRGGTGNAYIGTYNLVRCFTEEKVMKTVSDEHWENKEFSREEWLENY